MTAPAERASAGRAIGISIHTGWAACLVVGGSRDGPEIVANEVIELLGDPQRFCFHMAAEMEHGAAEQWLAQLRLTAVSKARHALDRMIAQGVRACAIVAKNRTPVGPLDAVLASHPRIHLAEGAFYRDVWRDACTVPVTIVAPASLDVSGMAKLRTRPWGKDQKLAALAAWTVLQAPRARR
jgi:hypothetical protein